MYPSPIHPVRVASNRFLGLHILNTHLLAFLGIPLLTCRNSSISLNKLSWTVQLHSEFITMNQNARTRLEEAINILQCSVRSLRVEEVCDRDEREADDCPDDPELVPEVLNTGKSSLYNPVIAYPVCCFGLLVQS